MGKFFRFLVIIAILCFIDWILGQEITHVVFLINIAWAAFGMLISDLLDMLAARNKPKDEDENKDNKDV
jgi:predicted transcriptional regulator